MGIFSEFNKDQTVMARELVRASAALVGCFWSAVISIYQKWSKERTAVNQILGHEQPKFTDTCGE